MLGSILSAELDIGKAYTSQEAATYYSDFLHTFPLSVQKRDFYHEKPSRLSENGLVAAYNMERDGDVLVDITSN